MTWVIARTELLQYWRDGRVLTVLAIVLLLSAAATVTGWNAVSTMERERAAAVGMDREIWNNQGDKNPHTAAHFSRYAFQPTFDLAIFDPGLTNHVGNAIWLEAHYRDPAALRPVEDAVEIQRIAEMSPVWVLQVFAPLLAIVLLFGAVAGERESGTLRQLMASGLRPAAFLMGKAASALVLLAALVLVVMAGSLILVRSDAISPLPDAFFRSSGLVALYIAYVAIFVFLALGVSALSSRSRTALLALAGLWIVTTVLGPRLGADVAGAISPAPSAPEFAARVEKESSDPFWGSADEAVARRQKVMDDLLAEYGVETTAELPINYDGYLLQASEEYANDVFDSLYDELWGGHERQRDITRVFAAISPRIAVQNISMALAGTDLFAYRHFADSAEQFRRRFVLLLNEEMIVHGGADGYAYVSGNDFWEQNPDFEYVPPGIREIVPNLRADAGIVLAWLGLAFSVAAVAVRRGLVGETAA